MKDHWKSEFASRFRRHEDELKWLYCELYHSDMRAYDYFTDMLYRAWEEAGEEGVATGGNGAEVVKGGEGDAA